MQLALRTVHNQANPSGALNEIDSIDVVLTEDGAVGKRLGQTVTWPAKARPAPGVSFCGPQLILALKDQAVFLVRPAP